MAIYVVIEYDLEPDFSWLSQEMYDPRSPQYDPIYRSKEDMDAGREPIDPWFYRDPDNHVALEMIAYETCLHENCDAVCSGDPVVDSLGNIDFLRDSDDWKTGTFCKLSQLADCLYLQELARQMGVKE